MTIKVRCFGIRNGNLAILRENKNHFFCGRTDIISKIEKVDVSGVVVGLLQRGPLAHDGQVDERGRRGPLVRTARHAGQVEALPDSPSQSTEQRC